MNNKDENYRNQGGSGFLIGVVLGGVLTLLFTTKKGREILKDLTEKGLEKFSEIQDSLDVTVVEEVDGEDYLEVEDRPSPKEDSRLLASESGTEEENKVENGKATQEHVKTESAKSVKRFFKKKS
jgi:gas vesicle protein